MDQTVATVLDTSVEFHGHHIRVKPPTEGQLVIMQRFAKRYSGWAGSASPPASGEEVIRVAARAFDIVATVIADPADFEKIEDLILSGEASLEEAVALLGAALEAIAEDTKPPAGAALAVDG
jgi:hypothetical protein